MGIVDQYLEDLSAWQEQVTETCMDHTFLQRIALPWFEAIAPMRARMYGIEALERFGVRGVVAQLINCFYRWQRLQGIIDLYPADPSESAIERSARQDTLQDTFGYSVLAGWCAFRGEPAVDWPAVWTSRHSPTYLFETMVTDGWFSDIQEGIPERALKLIWAMWRESHA